MSRADVSIPGSRDLAGVRPRGDPSESNWAGWALVVLLLLAQWGLFRHFAQREIVWAYPQNVDQLAYLDQSYRTFDLIRQHGLFTGLLEGMTLHFGDLPTNATGAALQLQAATAYVMAGPCRLTALAVNFAYFALLQLVLVGTLRWLGGRWSAALMGLGLLLTTTTAFYFAGGIFDFRLDFAAFCLYGIFVCLVIRSGVFRDIRWSLWAGGAAVLLVAVRFVTAIYLFGLLGLFFTFLLALWVARWKNFAAQQGVQRQIKGLLACGLLVAVLAVPVLWHSREAIARYYWIGHVVGHEKVLRAAESGTTTLLKALKFYPAHLLLHHAGRLFIRISLLILATGVGVAVFRRIKGESLRAGVDSPIDWTSAIAFAGLALLVPLLVLTADEAKSPQVAGIMVGPLLWGVLLVSLWLFGAHRGASMRPGVRCAYRGAAAVALLAGMALQFSRYTRQTALGANRTEVERVVGMYDRMADEARTMGWTAPRVASDSNADYLNAKDLTVLAYERQDLSISAVPSLVRLEAYAPSEIPSLYTQLRQSDFAILSLPTGPTESYQFPFDLQMVRLHPQLLEWCHNNMIELDHFRTADREVDLFVRPAVSVEGSSDGWVTGQGMNVTVRADVLSRFPEVRLRGEANFDYLGRVPNVSAYRIDPAGKRHPVAAELRANGTRYTITLRPEPSDIPANGMARFHLDFDAHFVPAQIRAGADTRELVIPLPTDARAVLPGPGGN